MSLCRQCSKPAGTANTGKSFAYCFDCRQAATRCQTCSKTAVFGGRTLCFPCSKQVTTQVCPLCQKNVTREAWKANTPCPACWKKERRAADIAETLEALMG